MLQKQAEAGSRAQEARGKVQDKASRMVTGAQEKLTALKLAEETSAALTKELNQQRHAEAEARKVAILQETIAKGVRLGSPVKRRAEFAHKEETEREQLRLSLDKRLADAGARAEAIRQETARKAAIMASPRIKVSSARQAVADPISTTEKTIEFAQDDYVGTMNQVPPSSISSKIELAVDVPTCEGATAQIGDGAGRGQKKQGLGGNTGGVLGQGMAVDPGEGVVTASHVCEDFASPCVQPDNSPPPPASEATGVVPPAAPEPVLGEACASVAATQETGTGKQGMCTTQ